MDAQPLLVRVARSLNGPFYPVSLLYRVVNDDMGLQIDFVARVHGIRSLASLRSRAVRLELAGASLLVADLEDIIRSKRAANRPRDRAMKSVKPRSSSARVSGEGGGDHRGKRSNTLRRESERALREQIRRLLALPMAKRTHFLRVRVPGGGSML